MRGHDRRCFHPAFDHRQILVFDKDGREMDVVADSMNFYFFFTFWRYMTNKYSHISCTVAYR